MFVRTMRISTGDAAAYFLRVPLHILLLFTASNALTAEPIVSQFEDNKNGVRRMIYFFDSDRRKIKIIDHLIRIKRQTTDTISLKKENWRSFGRSLRLHENGVTQKIECYTPIWNQEDYWETKMCGTEYHFDESGKITKTITHPLTCNYGCGEFKPEMPPGEWRVHATSLIVRDAPSIKAKQLGEIKRGELVRVTRDTQKIETILHETAPWVEIEYNGKKAFVFGGFLQDKSYPLVP